MKAGRLIARHCLLALVSLWIASSVHSATAPASKNSNVESPEHARPASGPRAKKPTKPASAKPKANASASDAARAPGPYASREAAQQFAQELAEREGLPIEWVQAALAKARRQASIERAVLPPPAGVPKNWAAYRARFVEPIRIEAGVRFWREHAARLERVQRDTGVDAALIVGVVGVETLYGRHMGTFSVLDALCTLAFDFPQAHPRASERAAFFRSELGAFLVLQHQAKADPAKLKGSYAGAMGMPQFMPGSVRRFAVDGDGDGHIDLHRNVADVVASVANYFLAHGWKPGLPTHHAVDVGGVRADDLQALLAPDILPTFNPAALRERGLSLPDTVDAQGGALALVALQNGTAPPSYVLGTENFYVVTRYNWSSYYAMAVIELGQAVRALVQP